ncbi:MAG: capsular biosynthesis protein [Betaproteobacteria bacterium]|nr:capsular biosynthesis protein [Betaproteobacteria bacterium]
MIDLHCHMLPGIDDGAPDEATALAMARIAVDDGITFTACTPHIYPGLYENNTRLIRQRVGELQKKLDAEGIVLRLTSGADAHLTPELMDRLKTGTAPTLNGGRYFLLEPPHHVAPPRFEESVFNFLMAGYVPVITHPERLTWIEANYEVFKRVALRGAWMQVTSGSLTGRFGDGAKYWGERMLDEGLVHILATDAHSINRRAPLLAEGVRVAEKYVGNEEAHRLVFERPRAILDDIAPAKVPPVPALLPNGQKPWKPGLWQRITGGRR